VSRDCTCDRSELAIKGRSWTLLCEIARFWFKNVRTRPFFSVVREKRYRWSLKNAAKMLPDSFSDIFRTLDENAFASRWEVGFGRRWVAAGMKYVIRVRKSFIFISY
jgi:hypothetical protein